MTDALSLPRPTWVHRTFLTLLRSRHYVPTLSGATLFAALLFGSGLAHATTVIHLDAAGLVRASHRIVHATVSTATGHYDERGTIVTRYVLAVTECLSGTPVDRLELVLPGGTVGSRTTIIPGLSRFQPGDELLLFLEKGTPEAVGNGERVVPAGLDQGVWKIVRTADGDPHALRSMRGLKRVRSPGKAPRDAATPPAVTPRTNPDGKPHAGSKPARTEFPNRAPLAALKAEIREVLRATKASPAPGTAPQPERGRR